MLPAGKTVTLSDIAGSNSIQLASGLSIASCKVMSNTLQLTLSSGAIVNVLGANQFTYEAGGNSTAGINQADISYTSFVTTILGLSMPSGSTIANGGAVVIGAGSAGATTVLGVGTTTTVAATAQADNFSLDATAAKATTANTQISLSGFDVTADQLSINTTTALGAVKLSALDGVDGIAVQANAITGETLINLGNDANGDVITLTLMGVADAALVNVVVV